MLFFETLVFAFTCMKTFNAHRISAINGVRASAVTTLLRDGVLLILSDGRISGLNIHLGTIYYGCVANDCAVLFVR